MAMAQCHYAVVAVFLLLGVVAGLANAANETHNCTECAVAAELAVEMGRSLELGPLSRVVTDTFFDMLFLVFGEPINFVSKTSVQDAILKIFEWIAFIIADLIVNGLPPANPSSKGMPGDVSAPGVAAAAADDDDDSNVFLPQLRHDTVRPKVRRQGPYVQKQQPQRRRTPTYTYFPSTTA